MPPSRACGTRPHPYSPTNWVGSRLWISPAEAGRAAAPSRRRRQIAALSRALVRPRAARKIKCRLDRPTRDSRKVREKKESACKPGSVEDDHSSGIAVTGELKRPTRKHAGTRAATCVATFLFGLAPGGVCRAAMCCHRRGALLPHPFTLTSFIAETSAVCFLLHFPSAHAAQELPGTSSTGARTFLHVSRETQRPSGRLRDGR